MAGCFAFFALLESNTSKQKVSALLNPAISIFVNLLNDNNVKVKEAAARLIAKAAENYSDVILNSQGLLNDL